MRTAATTIWCPRPVVPVAFRPVHPATGSVEIARNDSASQAFVKGRAMGLQFHPELDHDLLELWITDDLRRRRR